MTEIAYGWCSTIYENHKNLEDWENLLLVCLELGFRHLNPEFSLNFRLTHTEHHQVLADVAFKSRKREAIADLLHAWTNQDIPSEYRDDMLGVCMGHLIDLQNLGPLSPRLRQLVIRFVEIVGHQVFEGAGLGRWFELLDHFHVRIAEVREDTWIPLLLGVIRSPEGIRFLSHWYWELLAGLADSEPRWLRFGGADALQIAKTLIDAQEWRKLECWIGIEWKRTESWEIIEEGMSSESGEVTEGGVGSELAGITEGGLEHFMVLLFHQRPGAAQKLEQSIERQSHQYRGIPEFVESRVTRIGEALQRIQTRAHEAAQRQDAP